MQALIDKQKDQVAALKTQLVQSGVKPTPNAAPRKKLQLPGAFGQQPEEEKKPLPRRPIIKKNTEAAN